MQVENSLLEQRILKQSIIATLVVAAIGIAFGLYVGSQSIVFDGFFDAVDSSMAFLALVVSRLLTKEVGRRFQRGYWHFEPMVLALNGGVLVSLCAYAMVSSIESVMRGGRELDFGLAGAYALAVSGVALAFYLYGRRANTTLHSNLVALDVQSWLMSFCISGSLLCAFLAGLVIQNGKYSWMVPYIDPVALCLLTALLLPMPITTVFHSLKQVLQITPQELDEELASIVLSFSDAYGFEQVNHHVSQVGRGLFVELYVLVPERMNTWSVSEFDALRKAISDRIGGNGHDRWISISFTRDPRWL